MKAKKRGKRPGLRARSKNARKPNKIVKATPVAEYVMARPAMSFYAVEEGAPHEGERVLVRLNDGVFRYGMVMQGFFAAYDHFSEMFVQMAHPERITHWMEIIDPVPRGSAPATREAEFQAQGEMPESPERAEDVYA